MNNQINKVHNHLAISLILSALILVLSSFGIDKAQANTHDTHTHDTQAIKAMIINEANQNSIVPASLVLGVAKVESNFNPNALSSAGARGIMQIMPATARGEFGVGADILYDPLTNIRIGIAFLERLYHQYEGNWEFALSHYNGGSLKKRYGRYAQHNYTRGYVRKVLSHSMQYASLDTKNQLMQKIGAHQEIKGTNKQPRNIHAQQALATAYLLEPQGKTADWKLYLNAANQFLDPENAENMPEITNYLDAEPLNIQIRKSTVNYFKANQTPSSRQIKEQANFRQQILAKLNG